MPTPTGPAATRPADRYGDRPASSARRRGAVAAVGLLAAAFVGWAVWAGLQSGQREVRWEDVGYVVQDDTTVEVTFYVVKDADTTVECTLEALNGRFAVVGSVAVEVGPAPDPAVTRTATVRTAERAVTGVVDSCRAV